MYKRIELPYELTDLEGVFSKTQLDLHYNKHHKGYENKLNAVIDSNPELKEHSLEELVTKYHEIAKEKNNHALGTKIRQFGGGLINHNYFFSQFLFDRPLKDQDLIKAINKDFGSLENMFNELMTASMEVFGSGWGWIIVDKANNKLRVFKTFNQDTPQYMGFKPLIAVDV